MIERSALPVRCRVAGLASRRESGRNVIRIPGVVEVGLMAAHTRGGRAFEDAVCVTLRTLHRDVSARQWECRRRVIKFGSSPARQRVALLARCRKPAGDVIRILGAIEICLMAADAGAWCSLELSAHVAGVAVEAGMGPDQGKSCELKVIKLCTLPGVEGCVALLAGSRESQGTVVRRSRIHIRRGMTADAVGRESFEPSCCALLMARFAIESRMCAKQRESILVIANLADRCLPATYGVAAVALRALHTSAVDVSMAVAALTADIAEYRLNVTLRTSHCLVHTA